MTSASEIAGVALGPRHKAGPACKAAQHACWLHGQSVALRPRAMTDRCWISRPTGGRRAAVPHSPQASRPRRTICTLGASHLAAYEVFTRRR